MTEWSDAEISRRLALAIGWPFSERSIAHPWALVCCDGMTGFRQFDYRDPAVIWPIAERFNAFPQKMRLGPLWAAPVTPDGKRPEYPLLRWEYAETAAKAVALAVIKAKEQT